MKDKLIIIGNGGHGRVCSEIAELIGYKEVYFLDDDITKHKNVLGPIDTFEKYINDADFFVGIGSTCTRERIMRMILNSGASVISLIHPFSFVSRDAIIGNGTVIMAGVVINSGAKIGDGVIINTCSSVDHDCCVKDYTHISVGAHLAGTVTVGKATLIGAGSTVLNNINIPDNCTVGAGAVVIKSLDTTGTYVGIPATRIN